jgi:glycosyltransferase involved in cell wall biosynthesis
MFLANFKGFDIIHIHNYITFQNLVTLLRSRDTPIIFQPHGSLIFYSNPEPYIWNLPGKLYYQYWQRHMLGRASKIISVSPLEREQCRVFGVNDQRIAVVPNGIDVSEYSELPMRGIFREKFGISPNAKVILYLGRIHPMKGIDLLIKAFVALPDEYKLVIAGDNNCPYGKELPVHVAYEGLAGRVIFTGALYDRNKLSAYVDADVYVLPSRYEIFGMTLLEALACGLPVITTVACGFAPYIQNNVILGKVVAPFPFTLSQAIINLFKENQETNREYRRIWVRQFDWAKIAESVELVYKEAANGT